MSWTMVMVGDLCKLANGKAFKADDWSSDGYPIIRIQNLNDSTKPFNHWDGGLEKQVHVLPQDLLIAWSGTPGTSFGAHIWNGPEGVLNQHIFKVDLDESRALKSWIKFTINRQLYRLIDQAHGGVGLKHVTKGEVENLQIPLPPLTEQKRIAAILDSADALRAKRRAAIAKLDELVQSTSLDMFGDPVTNPKGWEYPRICETKTKIQIGPFGSLLHKEDYITGGVPLVNPMHIVNGSIKTSSEQSVTIEMAESLSNYRLRTGDVILGRRGEMGRSAVVTEMENGLICGTGSLFLRPSTKEWSAVYLAKMLRSKGIKERFERMCLGVTMPNLNRTMVGDCRIPRPPLPLQHQFASIVTKIEEQKSRLRAHLEELDTLFASLQSRAFKGEL